MRVSPTSKGWTTNRRRMACSCLLMVGPKMKEKLSTPELMVIHMLSNDICREVSKVSAYIKSLFFRLFGTHVTIHDDIFDL